MIDYLHQQNLTWLNAKSLDKYLFYILLSIIYYKFIFLFIFVFVNLDIYILYANIEFDLNYKFNLKGTNAYKLNINAAVLN